MISIEPQLKRLFEQATELGPDQILAWITAMQFQIAGLPDRRISSMDEQTTIQMTAYIPTLLGLLRIRSVAAIGENYFCVAFGSFSINYADGVAYASDGGKRIAFWRTVGFCFAELSCGDARETRAKR